MFLGDRGHNARDMVAKNRIVHPVYRSSEAPSAKLTDEQVAEMRRLFGTISQAEIARRFQISESQVHRIKTGKCWSPEGSTRVVTGME